VLYAVASPGILKLWPWVNQVCHRRQLTSLFFSHNTDQTPLTVSSKLPLEVVMQLFKRMGYVHCTPRLFLTGFTFSPPPPPPFQSTCYPRGGFRHACWAHNSQGRPALRTPRATK
jgi:hypothetical protein